MERCRGEKLWRVRDARDQDVHVLHSRPRGVCFALEVSSPDPILSFTFVYFTREGIPHEGMYSRCHIVVDPARSSLPLDFSQPAPLNRRFD